MMISDLKNTLIKTTITIQINLINLSSDLHRQLILSKFSIRIHSLSFFFCTRLSLYTSITQFYNIYILISVFVIKKVNNYNNLDPCRLSEEFIFFQPWFKFLTITSVCNYSLQNIIVLTDSLTTITEIVLLTMHLFCYPSYCTYNFYIIWITNRLNFKRNIHVSSFAKEAFTRVHLNYN